MSFKIGIVVLKLISFLEEPLQFWLINFNTLSKNRSKTVWITFFDFFDMILVMQLLCWFEFQTNSYHIKKRTKLGSASLINEAPMWNILYLIMKQFWNKILDFSLLCLVPFSFTFLLCFTQEILNSFYTNLRSIVFFLHVATKVSKKIRVFLV